MTWQVKPSPSPLGQVMVIALAAKVRITRPASAATMV
jgi:hypothetical protein